MSSTLFPACNSLPGSWSCRHRWSHHSWQSMQSCSCGCVRRHGLFERPVPWPRDPWSPPVRPASPPLLCGAIVGSAGSVSFSSTSLILSRVSTCSLVCSSSSSRRLRCSDWGQRPRLVTLSNLWFLRAAVKLLQRPPDVCLYHQRNFAETLLVRTLLAEDLGRKD